MCSCGYIKITADDAACKDKIDEAILELSSLRIVTHVAAFSSFGRLKRFSRLLDSGVSLGIHFNLSSGKSLSKPAAIPSLVDSLGRFHCPTPKYEKDMSNSLSQFIREQVPQLIQSEIQEEFTLQLRVFEDEVGSTPSFTTVHHDLDQVAVVRESINVILPHMPPRQAQLNSGLLAGVFCTFLSNLDDAGSAKDKVNLMINSALESSMQRKGIPAEIVCHPGYFSDSIADFTVYLAQRELEFKAWTDPEIDRRFVGAKRTAKGWCFENMTT